MIRGSYVPHLRDNTRCQSVTVSHDTGIAGVSRDRFSPYTSPSPNTVDWPQLGIALHHRPTPWTGPNLALHFNDHDPCILYTDYVYNYDYITDFAFTINNYYEG